MVDRSKHDANKGTPVLSIRIVFVYASTGRSHKSTADALTESIVELSREVDDLTAQVMHADIYQVGKVPLFRRAPQHYQTLCRHVGWLYGLVFRVTDIPIAKRLITGIIVRFYGRRIGQAIAALKPDVIMVLHPLFMADVLCELRSRSEYKWNIVSFVTDLGIAHSGWASASRFSTFCPSRPN